MYNIMKSVITTGRYELADMLHKIDTMWMQGDITDNQRDELTKLAREKADPAMTATVDRRLKDLEERLTALEKAMNGQTQEPTVEWPNFVVGRSYRNGDKVTFEGAHYVCTLPEHTDVCVWSPKDYPNYWRVA